MRAKERMRKIFLSVICTLCCGFIATGIWMQLPSAKADDVSLSTEQMQSKYSIGETLNTPRGTLIYDGKEYEGESYLTYPSGAVYSKNAYVLNESGLYGLTYKAYADNGTLLEKTITFTVAEPLFTVSGEKSSAYYGTHEKYATDKEGIVVKLVNGDVFTYNKVVDLSQNTYTDGIISFFNTPEIEGVQDAKSMIVRFTDVYDENNYFEVDFHTANNACVTAGPLNAAKVGLWRTRSTATDSSWTNITFENEAYQMFQGDTSWGLPLSYNMREAKDGFEIGDRVATISYDYASKRVYANPTSIYAGDGFVTDLDHEMFFKNNWKGFTTGEVIISIYGKTYNAASMGFVITDVNGEDLSEMEITQKISSQINVDTLGYSEFDLPFGIVGVPYKLFDVTMRSSYVRTTKFEQKVYRNYHSNKTEVNIENGYFTPTVAGSYTIEYTVTDSFGEKTIKTLDVQVKPSTTEKLTAQINSDGVTVGNALSEIRVHSITERNVSGKGELKAVAIAPSGNEYPIDTESWTFIAEEVGAHKVRYSLTDYISTATAEYTVTVESVAQPVFLDDVILNSYYIKGAIYPTPILTAHYISDKETMEIEAKAYISYNGEGREELGEKFTVEQTGTVQLIYIATVNGVTAEKIYTLKVVDVGYGKGNALNVHQYFQADETVSGEKGVYTGTVAPTNGDVTFDFIHSVGAWNFALELIPQGDTYDCVAIELIDSENTNVKMSIVLSAVGKKQTDIVVNDRYHQTIEQSFYNTKFSVGYTEDNNIVTLNLAQLFEVLLNADGTEFTGFPSKKIFVKFALKNVIDAYSVQVVKLNSHSFASKSDGVDPSYYYEGVELNKIYARGDVITIPQFYVEDVVDIGPNLTVNVKDPQGNFVRSVDGVLLDGSQDLNRAYQVEITQYGVYKCWYAVSDYSGNGGRLRPVNYTVEDHVAPIVTLSKARVEYKTNDKVKVAKVSVTDDLSATENCIVKIYVRSPKDDFFAVTNNEFTATQKGIYTIFYYVYDEMENVEIIKYQIMVS